MLDAAKLGLPPYVSTASSHCQDIIEKLRR
jgi:hypothetical protein